MSSRIPGTNHTSSTVSSLDRTSGFLRDCLGFELVSRAPRDPALASRITVDDVPAAVVAAERCGVKPIALPVAIDQGPNKGRRAVYLRDWDGITIELIEAK